MSGSRRDSRVLRLGTRASALALAQSRLVADAITARTGWPVEFVEITTKGDVAREPLARIGGTGVFVSALREALLAGDIDLAVHSYKDLPTAPAPGLVIAAVPPRADPRDILISRYGRKLADLPAGARVGTGSPRRAAQLHALGLGLDVIAIRGNVDTRIGYLAKGELDAVVLARAGLERLGRLDEASEVLDLSIMLPAPGQGALAVECLDPATSSDVAAHRAGTEVPATPDAGDRAGAADVLATLGELEHPASRAAVTAERALLAALEAGCSAPVGAYAELIETETGAELGLRAVVAAVDGSASVRMSNTGPPSDAGGLGRRLAAALLDGGAAGLMQERPR
ncbi:MAG TPA: hydroxymethylbilane synthase [Actinomycetes bacterium]|nr:hydroxymethylbilane synthase [Actinomycetes bacterium]